MKPSNIKSILDLALRARKKGFRWNPCFVGAPGVGKSEIVQQWCSDNNMPFIDLRLAYLESVDLVGFPTVEKVVDEYGNVRQVTSHNTPDFWPTSGSGVLLLEEPNRGTTSVMNACMQLLTDRKVHKYTLPEGWVVVSCINPEDSTNDVNTMDTALKDRFEFFNVVYDKQAFLDYMREADYDPTIIMFVESGAWQYVLPESVGNVPGTKYISPRTFSKLNAARQAGIDREDELMVYNSILGQTVGESYYKFVHDENPVLYSDLKLNKKAAFKKLKGFCDAKNYKSGYVSITVKNIVQDAGMMPSEGGIEDDLLAELLQVIPTEQGYLLIQELEYARKGKDDNLLSRLCEQYPKVGEYFKNTLSYKRNK